MKTGLSLIATPQRCVSLIAGSVLVFLVLFSGISPAADIYAVGNKTRNWNSNNWATTDGGTVVNGLQPVADDDVYLGTGSKNVTVNSTTAIINHLTVNGAGTVGLTIDADGTLQFVGRLLAGASVNGIFNLTINSGGTLQQTAGSDQVTLAKSGSSVTTVNQSGGKFIVNSEASLWLTSNATAAVTYNLSGGELNGGLYFSPGVGKTNFNWTGGSLTAQNIGFSAIHNSGACVLNVGGTDAVGAMAFYTTGARYTQDSGASMRLDMASASSYDAVTCAGTVALAGTINLNLLSDFVPTEGLTFDVITASDITDNGLTLSGTGAKYFKYAIVQDGSNKVLRLTAVHEPSK